MTRQSIVRNIGKVVSNVTAQEVGEFGETTRIFEDLNLDSVSILEMLVALEGEFGIEVDPDALQPQDLETVGSVADYVEARISRPESYSRGSRP